MQPKVVRLMKTGFPEGDGALGQTAPEAFTGADKTERISTHWESDDGRITTGVGNARPARR